MDKARLTRKAINLLQAEDQAAYDEVDRETLEA
jgi:hypothetical protein